jgi:hypothetical protein
MIGSIGKKKIAQHARNRTQVVIDYLTEHGPTRRSIAIEGIARLYLERHTRGGSVTLSTTKFRMADHLITMEKAGELIRGPRPQQILSLPQG